MKKRLLSLLLSLALIITTIAMLPLTANALADPVSLYAADAATGSLQTGSSSRVYTFADGIDSALKDAIADSSDSTKMDQKYNASYRNNIGNVDGGYSDLVFNNVSLPKGSYDVYYISNGGGYWWIYVGGATIGDISMEPIKSSEYYTLLATDTDGNNSYYYKLSFTTESAIENQTLTFNCCEYNGDNQWLPDFYAAVIIQTDDFNPLVTVDPSSADMAVGGTQQLTATPKNFSGDVTISYSSDNTSVATVDSNGLVTGVAAGSANITVTATGGTDTETAACAITVYEEATVTYSLGDDVSAEGTVPAAETVAKGSTLTIPTNRTLYVEGKTLTGWNDGTTTYDVGTEMTVNGDMTLTPVFTENTAALGDADTTVTFDFQRKNGAPTWTGSATLLVEQATIGDSTIDVKMDIDTTNGKLANEKWTDWAQVNGGTKFTVPTVAGSVVTVGDIYDDTGTYTINGVSHTGDDGSETMTAGGTCDIVAGEDSGRYWRTITVTYTKTAGTYGGLDWIYGYSGTTVGSGTPYNDNDGNTGITLKSKNAYTILPEEVSSGTAIFSTDVYLPASDSSRGFRIFLENAYDTAQPTTTNICQVASSSAAAPSIGFDANVGGNPTSTFTNGTLAAGSSGWFNVTLRIDYTAQTVTATLINKSDNSTETKSLAFSDLGIEDYTLRQIRLINRSGSPVFANMSYTYLPEGDTDSGYYYAGNNQSTDKLGVIRFFQAFAGTADSYGFVFVKSDSNDADSYDVKIGDDTTETTIEDGIYGTLTEIPEAHLSDNFYAKPYVTIGTKTYYGSIISATVAEDLIDATSIN